MGLDGLVSERELDLLGRRLGWSLPDGSWPVEGYVPELFLVEMVERYELEPDPIGDVVLRSMPEPWPFPPQQRVVPELVAAVDLADGLNRELADLGRNRCSRTRNVRRATSAEISRTRPSGSKHRNP